MGEEKEDHLRSTQGKRGEKLGKDEMMDKPTDLDVPFVLLYSNHRPMTTVLVDRLFLDSLTRRPSPPFLLLNWVRVRRALDRAERWQFGVFEGDAEGGGGRRVEVEGLGRHGGRGEVDEEGVGVEVGEGDEEGMDETYYREIGCEREKEGKERQFGRWRRGGGEREKGKEGLYQLE